MSRRQRSPGMRKSARHSELADTDSDNRRCCGSKRSLLQNKQNTFIHLSDRKSTCIIKT